MQTITPNEIGVSDYNCEGVGWAMGYDPETLEIIATRPRSDKCQMTGKYLVIETFDNQGEMDSRITLLGLTEPSEE